MNQHYTKKRKNLFAARDSWADPSTVGEREPHGAGGTQRWCLFVLCAQEQGSKCLTTSPGYLDEYPRYFVAIAPTS